MFKLKRLRKTEYIEKKGEQNTKSLYLKIKKDL